MIWPFGRFFCQILTHTGKGVWIGFTPLYYGFSLQYKKASKASIPPKISMTISISSMGDLRQIKPIAHDG
jgi:hypothetical protein